MASKVPKVSLRNEIKRNQKCYLEDVVLKYFWSLLPILCDLLWAPRFPRYNYVNEFKKE
jgi:hypothetical protein